MQLKIMKTYNLNPAHSNDTFLQKPENVADNKLIEI